MSAQAGAAAPLAIPDTAEARTELEDVIFAPAWEAASAGRKTVTQKETGGSVYFQSAVKSDSLYLIFPPPGVKDPATAAAGGCIIKRGLADGSFLWMKVFVQNDAGSYVRLSPLGSDPAQGRTRMDVYINGEVFQQGVTIARPFSRLLTAPLASIVRLSEGLVDWSLVLPQQRTGGDAEMEKIVRTVRARLKSLGDVEDGAMDADGRYVFIESGEPQPGRGGFNCSGFSKFIVDGFYAPLADRPIAIDALKRRNLESRGNRWSGAFEVTKDPYFGLDWTRNLAGELAAARMGGQRPPVEFADVRNVERFEYTEDVGYSMEDIQEVLYILARRSPGYLYLGSLSREAADGSPVRQHHHIAVFMPYTDEKGIVRIVVMERNRETSIESLKSRYPMDSIHLVRIGIEGDFQLP